MIADRARLLVAQAVDARRPEVEQLVDEALEQVVAEVVAERLAAGNGDRAVIPAEVTAAPLADGRSDDRSAKSSSVPAPTAERLCVDCGQKPAQPGRRVCTTCKHRRRSPRSRVATSAQNGASGDKEGRPMAEAVPTSSAPQTGSSPPRGEGVDPVELARRVNRHGAGRVSANELTRWLVDESGLAILDDEGRLHVGDRGWQLAGAAFG